MHITLNSDGSAVVPHFPEAHSDHSDDEAVTVVSTMAVAVAATAALLM